MRRAIPYLLLSVFFSAHLVAYENGADPGEADAYFKSGVLRMQQREYDKAIADFTEAIRLDPKNADACFDRGNAYYRKGELDKAIADFDETIRLDPKSLNAYYNRGVAYGKKGNFDKAIENSVVPNS